MIVSREAGAAELIDPGVNGFLLEDFNDAIELAEKMRLLLEDRRLGASIGAAARQTAERYSWDETASQTMRVYQQFLPKRLGSDLKEQSLDRISG